MPRPADPTLRERLIAAATAEFADGGYSDNTALTATISAMTNDCQAHALNCDEPMMVIAVNGGEGGTGWGINALFDKPGVTVTNGLQDGPNNFGLVMSVRVTSALRGVLAAWMSILGVALLLAAFALSAQGGTDAPTPEGANGDPLPVAPTHREGPP